MADLRGSGTRAVLIGTGCATGGLGADGLTAIPAVPATVNDLAAALVQRCGMIETNVRVVLDPALPYEVGEALAEETSLATEALLIYFCGHGLVSLDGDLYLATAKTDLRAGYLAHTAVAYAQVRNAVLDSPARVKIVILDCCYSGRAFATLGNAVGAEATGLSRIHGGYVLTAAGANEAAHAPAGEKHTAFGGQLIQLLTDGDPEGPPQLSLQHVHAYLRQMLPARGFPRPHRLATEAADGFILAPNPAHRLEQPDDPDPVPMAKDHDQVNPYPGLAAFGTADAAWFYARGADTRAVLDRLAKAQPDDPPVVLVGPSGVGKSSLLQAGVMNALAADDDHQPGGARRPVLLTPGPHPMTALSAALNIRRNGELLTVLVDQFEEIFTECTDAGERDSFVEAVAGESGDTVVLGLRADFYRHCLAFPALRRALESSQILLGPLTDAQVGTVIQAPAASAGLTLQSGLAQIMLQDVHDHAAALTATEDSDLDLQQSEVLPLLAHALHETWVRRQGRMLTVIGYADSGRVSRAVEESAERVYAGLDDRGQAILHSLVLRLAAVHVGMAITRQLIARDALVEELDSESTAVAEEIVSALARAGLLATDGDRVGLAHSAVLRAWPRLRTWLEEDNQAMAVRRQLRAAAQRWRQSHRQRGLLYRGTRLSLATELTRPAVTTLPALSREFLNASIRYQRWSRRRRIAMAASVLLVVGVVTGYRTNWFQGEKVCPSGMDTSSRLDDGNMCVGVTDGSYVFQPELAQVEGRIATENARVAALHGSDAVTVALYTSVPTFPPDAANLTEIRQQLEGAYTAQTEANKHGNGVQLFMANGGESGADWARAVGRLKEVPSLAGVIFVGIGSGSKLNAAQTLRRNGVPTAVGLFTADMFDNIGTRILRVGPTNRQLVGVMARYIDTLDSARSAVVVADSNAEAVEAQSLREDIVQQSRPIMASAESYFYQGSRFGIPGTPVQFDAVIKGICAARPAAVFYAGKAADIRIFLSAVAARVCRDTPVEILIPSSGDIDLSDQASALVAGRISVTTFVTVGWSTRGGKPTSTLFDQYRNGFFGSGFDRADAASANTISAHDALAALAAAIRAADATGRHLDAAAVTVQLSNLHGPLAVPGVEENLSFAKDGMPAHKTVGIIQYAPELPPRYLKTDYTD